MVNMASLMQKAQSMQAKVQEFKDNLPNLQGDGQSGGGVVIATVDGNNKLLNLKISPDLLSEDVDVVEDMIQAAINDAQNNMSQMVTERTNQMTADLGLPPGMNLPI